MTAISATGTINISYSAPDVYYNINGGTNNIISLWPVTINNSNTSTTLKVLFMTDITLTQVDQYFQCGTDNIQFGDTSLKGDGTRPIITISGTIDYPGLIQNYDSSFFTSYNNIYVYNLFVKSVGSTLLSRGGWVGQENFSTGATCYFINCSSDGNIPIQGGGIVGRNVGNGGNLTIICCSSSGNIDGNGGGISGFETGIYGICNISNCFSTGSINSFAGGIVGSDSGLFSSSFTINNCYSTGSINSSAGGITGANIQNITVSNCYSLGIVSPGGGGIFGNNSNTNATAINCYTAEGNNIFAGTPGTIINCYAANGSWSDVIANTSLQSSYWISLATNTPYVLKSFGSSPYTLANIVANNIVQTYSTSLNPGDSTIAAPVAGYKSFQIMNNNEPTITIDASGGTITTTSATPPGTYTLIIYAVDDYTTTTFILEVLGQTPIGNILAQTIPPCCEPNVPHPNPQASNYSSDVITNKKGGKTLDKNVEDFYVGIATGQRRAQSKPIFKSYHDYMNYLQGKYR